MSRQRCSGQQSERDQPPGPPRRWRAFGRRDGPAGRFGLARQRRPLAPFERALAATHAIRDAVDELLRRARRSRRRQGKLLGPHRTACGRCGVAMLSEISTGPAAHVYFATATAPSIETPTRPHFPGRSFLPMPSISPIRSACTREITAVGSIARAIGATRQAAVMTRAPAAQTAARVGRRWRRRTIPRRVEHGA